MTQQILVAVVATVVAFLISTAEAAFTRMSRVRAAELVEERRAGATALVKVVSDTAAYLSVLSFVRVVAESVVAVMITLLVVNRVEGTWQPFVIATAIMAAISFAVGCAAQFASGSGRGTGGHLVTSGPGAAVASPGGDCQCLHPGQGLPGRTI